VDQRDLVGCGTHLVPSVLRRLKGMNMHRNEKGQTYARRLKCLRYRRPNNSRFIDLSSCDAFPAKNNILTT
jgi:hypothetical protein